MAVLRQAYSHLLAVFSANLLVATVAWYRHCISKKYI